MKNHTFLTISGLLLTLAGLTLLCSENIGIEYSKLLMPFFILGAGIFSYLFSKNERLPKIAKQYHMAQGLGLLFFAIAIYAFTDSLTSFLMLSTYFILVYGLFEIVFIFAVLNTKHNINKKILFSRMAAGIINLVGGFALLLSSISNEATALIIASILIIIGGVSIILFARKLNL